MRSRLAFRAVPVVVSSHQVRPCVGTLASTGTAVGAAAHGQGGPPALLQHGAGPLLDKAPVVCTYHEQCSPLSALSTAGAHHQGSRGARQREGFFKSPAGRQGARDGPEGVK